MNFRRPQKHWAEGNQRDQQDNTRGEISCAQAERKSDLATNEGADCRASSANEFVDTIRVIRARASAIRSFELCQGSF